MDKQERLLYLHSLLRDDNAKIRNRKREEFHDQRYRILNRPYERAAAQRLWEMGFNVVMPG